MAKKGRPFVYQSDTEKPVTVSVRLPRDVYDQVERYVKMHPGMTLAEFLLDGARLRLDTPADPRDLLLSDDNTVIQEIQAMIRAAVQAEIGTLRDFLGSAMDALKLSPTPEAAAAVIPVPGYEVTPGHSVVTDDVPAPAAAAEPVPPLVYDGNTVLQEKDPQPQGKRGAMRQRILQLLGEHPEGLSADEIRVYLKPQKPLGDTMQGMVRQQLLTKQGSGQAVRYRALQKHQGQPA